VPLAYLGHHNTWLVDQSFSFRHKNDMLQVVAGHKLYIHVFFNNENHIGFGISRKVLKKTLNHMTLWRSTALTTGLRPMFTSC